MAKEKATESLRKDGEKNSKELLKKVKNLELELKLETKKRELESLEHEREKEKVIEEIEKLKKGL